MNSLTSTEFGNSLARAKKLAKSGPVFITDHGEPTHVFLTMKQYGKIMAKYQHSLAQIEPALQPRAELPLSSVGHREKPGIGHRKV